MPRRMHSYYLDEELTEGLDAIRDRDGILPSETGAPSNCHVAEGERLQAKGEATTQEGRESEEVADG